eukprot:5282148-Pleurochrysis_carterae.AAC.4
MRDARENAGEKAGQRAREIKTELGGTAGKKEIKTIAENCKRGPGPESRTLTATVHGVVRVVAVLVLRAR